MIDATTDIKLIDCNFKYKYEKEVNTFTAVAFSGKYLKGDSQMHVTCPDNHVMSKTIIYRTYFKSKYSRDLITDTSKVIYLDIKCTPCGNGKYTIQGSSYLLKDLNETFDNFKCKTCPSGGSCSTERIKSLPMYWGYNRKALKSISFLPCPSGYCDLDAKSYDSCEPNRTGRLCSRCISNHSLDIFSTACIGKENCSEMILYIIYGLVILIGCFITTILMYTEDIKERIKSLWLSMEKKFSSCRMNLCQKVCCCNASENKNKNSKNIECVIIGDHAREESDDDGSNNIKCNNISCFTKLTRCFRNRQNISEEVDFQENAINEDGESAESMKSAKDYSAKSSMF